MARILLRRSCRADRGGDREPLGTYSSQETYYDDVTKETFVTGTPSGLPSCQVYTRPTTEKIDEYCSGNDSIEVYHDGRGGITELRIEGGCGVAGCNLFFESVVLTEDSGSGGSITFTMNEGDYQYSLDAFYGKTFFSSVPTSSLTGLAPGDYTLTVRDEATYLCMPTFDFTIKEVATYSLKWWFEYFDIHGVKTRVEIYGKNFQGVASEIEYVGSSPVTIDWKGKGQDKYRPIVMSECRLNVVAKQDFEYITLFSSDEKEHRVNVLKNGSVYWMGFIVPDVYNEPYLSPPYNMQVSAVDGLNTLSNYQYDLLAEKVSLIDIVRYCLKKIGHDIKIYDATYILPETSVSGSGLQRSYVRGDAFDGLDCYEVLSRVLFSQLARISMDRGRWYIVPIDALVSSYIKREWDIEPSQFTPVATSVNPIKTIGKVDDPIFFIEGNQNMTIDPAYKEVNILYDYGRADQLLKNNEFEFEGNTLPEWDGELFAKRSWREPDKEGTAVAVQNGQIRQTIELDPSADKNKLEIDVEYRVMTSDVFEPPIIEFTFEEGEKVEIVIRINGNYLLYSATGIESRGNRTVTYKAPSVNAADFTTWLNAQSGFSNYNVSTTNDVVRITAKTASVTLDYGDVEIIGMATVTDRNNGGSDLDDIFINLIIRATDVYGGIKTLTTHGHWMDEYNDPHVAGTRENRVKIPALKANTFQTFSLLTDALPENTKTLDIEVMGMWRGIRPDRIIRSLEAQYRKIEILYLPHGSYAPKEQRLRIDNPSKDVTFTPPVYELKLGSVPIIELPFRVPNAVNIYKNTLWYLFGEDYHQSVFFKIKEEDPGFLIDIIGKLIFANNYRPAQTITGTLRGNINFNDSFVDPNNPGRLFIINSMKYNDRKKGYDVELVEMLSYSSGLIYNTRLLENGEYRLLEDDTIRMLE